MVTFVFAKFAEAEPVVPRECLPKINCAAKFLKITPMKNGSQKNESKIIQHGKSGGFILCDFRTGSPGNSAKVGAVGKIHFVQ
jgi:hypothetical protein